MSEHAPAARRLLSRGRGVVSRWLRPALDPHAPTGLLTAAQVATLRALTEVVATGNSIPEADWEPVRAALVLAARTEPGWRDVYGRACPLLDRLAGGSFAGASLAARSALVVADRLAVRPVSAAELLMPARRVHHEVRELLVPHLIRLYWDSPAGWAQVGYDTPLGGCRDPFAYTQRPRGRPR